MDKCYKFLKNLIFLHHPCENADMSNEKDKTRLKLMVFNKYGF